MGGAGVGKKSAGLLLLGLLLSTSIVASLSPELFPRSPKTAAAESPLPPPTSGPAYSAKESAAPGPSDWPMFRHDPAHTGYNPDEATLKPPLELKWKYFDGGGAAGEHVSVAVSSGVLYIGSGGYGMTTLDAATGDKKYRLRTDSFVESTPAVAGGLVYLAAENGIYFVDAAQGTVKWIFDIGNRVTSPTVAGGVVFAGANYGIYALDAGTGAKKWNNATGGASRSVAVAEGRVYVAGEDGGLYALDAATGGVCYMGRQ